MNNAVLEIDPLTSLQPISPQKILRRQSNFDVSISGNNARVLTKFEITNKIARRLPIELQFALNEVSFSNGQTIYDYGDSINFVYFPQNCVGMRLNLLEDGSMVEVGMIGKEGLWGGESLFGSLKADELSVAEIGGKALRIRTDILRDYFRNSEDFRREIYTFNRRFLTQISQRSVCRCRHSVAAQLSGWLLMISQRLNGAEIPLTHEIIARRLGARRAGITVAVNDLENVRAIRCGRGKIFVENRQTLENHACECYIVLAQN